jgi:ABC-type oligopeptide transport system substrate-binding subunit
VELWENYQNSKDEVTVTYVIRSKDGAPVSLNSEQSTWNKLWDKKFCELDIPQMPEIAGEYTVDIYFNGQQINKDVLAFTIT